MFNRDIINSSQFFFLGILSLCLIGLVMVYSSSFIYANETFNSSHFFFFRQFVFLIIGPLFMLMASLVKFENWLKYSFFIHLCLGTLLFLTLVPGVGVGLKGASRWINLGFIQIQPSEILKYTSSFTFLFFFENFFEMNRTQKIQWISVLLFPPIVLFLQPDFGGLIIYLLLMLFISFLCRFPKKYFSVLLLSAFSLISFSLAMAPYRVQRILTFLDPWKDPKRSGFQIIQSYLAFANGSIWGKGLGNGQEKLFYLPEAHNDFILSVIGEEFGFMGVSVIVLLYIFTFYHGMKLLRKIQFRHHMIIGYSVLFILALQAFLNMGVVLGLLPTKGLNLPFISYGGSSLISNFIGLGIFLSSLKLFIVDDWKSFFKLKFLEWKHLR
jgi:cell division protein FtsW